ncbi:MAG TPA: kelch repeat-containing protein [Blastocatellia bacterium]
MKTNKIPCGGLKSSSNFGSTRKIAGMITAESSRPRLWLFVLVAALVLTQALPRHAYMATRNIKDRGATPRTTPSATSRRSRGGPQYSDLEFARFGHTATALSDGRVLISGGEDESGPVAVSEVFDPQTRTFSPGAFLAEPRAYHTATALPDGRVLIAGGLSGQQALSSTEFYDPATASFVGGPALTSARAGHTATLLADGRVLLVGGDVSGSAEIFNPISGRVAEIPGELQVARQFHSAVLLQSGKVLIVGGHAPEGAFGSGPGLGAAPTAEIFDPATLSFTLTRSPMRGERVRPELNLLPDGKVQIIGGDQGNSIEIYDPAVEAFAAYTPLVSGPQVMTTAARAAFIHSGSGVQFAGGQAGKGGTASPANFDRSDYTLMDRAGSELAMVAGGKGQAGHALNSVMLLASSEATLTTGKTNYPSGQPVNLRGSGWEANETVAVEISWMNKTSVERTIQIKADDDGNISSSKFKTPETKSPVTFTLVATGSKSHRSALTVITNAVNPGNEAISSFASNCTTAQSAFDLGNSVCVDATGAWLPVGGPPQDELVIVDPGGFVRNNASGCLTTSPAGPTITTDPEQFSFTLPSTSTTTCGATTYQNVGQWVLEIVRISTSSVVAKANITVANPNVCSGVVCPVQIRQGNDPGLCGAHVNLMVTPLGPCTVTLTNQNDQVVESGDFFPVGVTTITATPSTGTPCSFSVVISDTEPPTVHCPSTIVATTTGTSAVVTFPTPTATDNCPGVSAVTCSPASGSSFPVGTTTVTCSATDAAGNIGTCTFQVIVGNFDTCVKDATTGDNIQWNSKTGEYAFQTCGSGAMLITGTGQVAVVNGNRTLTDTSAAHMVKASYSPGQMTGTAVITIPIGQGISQTYHLNQTTPGATCSCST